MLRNKNTFQQNLFFYIIIFLIYLNSTRHAANISLRSDLKIGRIQSNPSIKRSTLCFWFFRHFISLIVRWFEQPNGKHKDHVRRGGWRDFQDLPWLVRSWWALCVCAKRLRAVSSRYLIGTADGSVFIWSCKDILPLVHLRSEIVCYGHFF